MGQDERIMFYIGERAISAASMKRLIFLDITTLLADGLFTLLKDKKQDKLLFVFDNVYRRTQSTIPIPLLPSSCADNGEAV